MGKNVRWRKKRHAFYFHVERFLVRIYAKLKYRYRGKKFNNRRQPYLFLLNHQTPLDQNLLYLSLPKLPYTVTSEDLFAMGRATRFIRYANAPIPFKKSMSDVKAVMTCMRVAREGNSIALFPEGNRTFTGETCYIKPAVAKLVKAIKLPVAVFKVSGGYAVQPRYADKPRKAGRVTGKVTRVIPYEEYKDMTDEALYELLSAELYADESVSSVPCKSNRRAEFMERAVYLCPVCKRVGTLSSKGNEIACSACGSKGIVDEHLCFQKDFPVRTIREWTSLQNEWVNAYDVEKGREVPLTAENVRLVRLDLENACKHTLAENVPAKLYSDRLEVGDTVYSFDNVDAMTVCGKKLLGFYAEDKTYQLDGANNFCALKYVNLYYHYRNEKEGENVFLGI